MTVETGNLFADVSAANAGEEIFSELLARPGLKIERIISQGQVSPPEVRQSKLGKWPKAAHLQGA